MSPFRWFFHQTMLWTFTCKAESSQYFFTILRKWGEESLNSSHRLVSASSCSSSFPFFSTSWLVFVATTSLYDSDNNSCWKGVFVQLPIQKTELPTLLEVQASLTQRTDFYYIVIATLQLIFGVVIRDKIVPCSEAGMVACRNRFSGRRSHTIPCFIAQASDKLREQKMPQNTSQLRRSNNIGGKQLSRRTVIAHFPYPTFFVTL